MRKSILVYSAATALICSATPYAVVAQAPEGKTSSAAADPAVAEKIYMQQLVKIDASLKKQTGDITLSDAKTTLRLANDYYYISPEDTKKVLVDAWGNTPDAASGTLGMIFPKGSNIMSKDTWGAVLTFEATGFVKDDDAASADYDELMTSMKEGETEANKERGAAGYDAINLVGWAERPQYDKAGHSIVWARNIKFSSSPVNTLNYDIRKLGRFGVLSMNMVSSMPQLAEIKGAAAKLRNAADFDKGARYADFDDSVDKVAEYGVGGLVAAGVGVAVIKKLGLLGIILAFGKKFFVLGLLAFAAIGRWVKGLFGRRDDDLEV